ncbi:TetR/AcrR family transcriptional regulator C-terminal domain-containing protein [Streptomyces jietaisiensis]|uniref:TetR/AcrR family transcriptional regulator C-terminal domain-containing protein n=1 Tax=Streptomyces griseoaurantiacus TaxID=68213 RepID=UPI00324F6556
MAKGITREQIVTAALDLLDNEGMDALTVRALASRLDVRASALYWHVRNKQELLDEMATEVMRRVAGALAAVPPGDGRRDGLTAYAGVLRSEYLLHRDGARMFSGTRITDPAVVRMKEPSFARWAASGWRPADADDAIDLVTAFVVGFVIEEQEMRQAAGADPSRYPIDQRDAWLGEGASLVKEAGHLHDEGDRRFQRLLGMILDGIGARPGV